VVEDTREYLRLLGINEQRLRVKWISASEGTEFAAEIRDFTRLLQSLPEKPFPEPKPGEFLGSEISDQRPLTKVPLNLTSEQTTACQECSSCNAVCPVHRNLPAFSPKQIINQTAMGLTDLLLPSREVWACLGCEACNSRCPALIDIAGFLRSFRARAREKGNFPLESHHGLQQTIARFQTHPLKQNRTAWAQKAGRFKDRGDIFYFVGCLPFFDITFRYLNISPLESARSALRLLNRLGVEPVISNTERCCGHDALWSGDEHTFRDLALWNLETIEASGARMVLFGCPEGYATFRFDYPRLFGPLPFEVMYLTDFLEREIPESGLRFKSHPFQKVTYQDPCRLGRRSGIFTSPRNLLRVVPGVDLVEMERSGENALCCGTSAWMECSACSKTLQMERLREAEQTGAGVLITACPKCRIHLTCAKLGEDVALEVKDIYTYLVEHLEDKSKQDNP
jgi:Fe-S oxidoreductase